MRSEERASIIFVALLFLWGTIITEPLHSFVRVFTNIINSLLESFGRNIEGKIGDVIFLVVIVAVVIGSLLLTKTRIATYIPCIYFSIITVAYLVDCISSMKYDLKTVVSIAIMLAVIIIFHVFNLETPLIWASDICIYSLVVFLVTGLLFLPLRALMGSYGKILYITNYQKINLAIPFNGFLHLPALIWGIFFVIISILPIVYFSFSRVRKN